jgi:hypothetical protein
MSIARLELEAWPYPEAIPEVGDAVSILRTGEILRVVDRSEDGTVLYVERQDDDE